ncbi:DUF2062 domain-containing protein [Bacteroidota bacterium]
MKKLKSFLKTRFIIPLSHFLKQGLTAKKLSLTLALGITLGIIPFFGVNTMLLTVLSIVFRLNLIAIQIVNYGVYIFQIVLFIPFLKFGQLIFEGPRFPYETQEIINMFKTDFFGTIIDIWHLNLLGLIIWLIVSIPCGILIYYLSLPVFTRYADKFKLD